MFYMLCIYKIQRIFQNSMFSTVFDDLFSTWKFTKVTILWKVHGRRISPQFFDFVRLAKRLAKRIVALMNVDRRNFLKGVGVAIALPLLESMSTLRAAQKAAKSAGPLNLFGFYVVWIAESGHEANFFSTDLEFARRAGLGGSA